MYRDLINVNVISDAIIEIYNKYDDNDFVLRLQHYSIKCL